jgi:pilus assembly protein Flp/PilA
MVRIILWWEGLKSALRNEKGQGMVEYAVLLVVVATIAVGLSMTGISTAITAALTKVQGLINGMGAPAAGG